MSQLVLPSARRVLTRRRLARPALGLAGWCLVLGLALRLVHYLWNHSIWYDEAVLLANVLGKDWAGLLGLLDDEVAAPPLFLWGLRAMALLFGDHPYVWRLPPLLISCLTLVLMAMLARRMLRPGPAALLVGLVAFSDGFVWLGCNVKPYILDAFLAAGLLYAYVMTEGWPPAPRILIFVPAAPVLLCVSYPSVFVYAGLLLALLPAVVRQRQPGPWAAYLTLAAVVLATFAWLYLGPIRAQRVPGLVEGWKNKFPNLSEPASVPGWIVGNTFLVLHYCYNPIGAGCVFLIAAGAWRCLRQGRPDWVCVCLGPVAACLLAACLQAYPYSNNRLILFTAPGIGLMIGVGASAALDRWRARPGWALAGLLALLILPEVGLCALRLHKPWDEPDGAGSTRFVQERRRPGDLVASDGGTYHYFFFGQVRTLAEVARTPGPAGQRVWVLLDQYGGGTVPQRRERVLVWLMPAGWDLRSETLFRHASVFLLVRHAPEEPPAARRVPPRAAPPAGGLTAACRRPRPPCGGTPSPSDRSRTGR
jgi:hypothetical protein